METRIEVEVGDRAQQVIDLLRQARCPENFIPTVDTLLAKGEQEINRLYLLHQMELCQLCFGAPTIEQAGGVFRAVCCRQQTEWADIDTLPTRWNQAQAAIFKRQQQKARRK